MTPSTTNTSAVWDTSSMVFTTIHYQLQSFCFCYSRMYRVGSRLVSELCRHSQYLLNQCISMIHPLERDTLTESEGYQEHRLSRYTIQSAQSGQIGAPLLDKLPRELRDKVWNFVLLPKSGPRNWKLVQFYYLRATRTWHCTYQHKYDRPGALSNHWTNLFLVCKQVMHETRDIVFDSIKFDFTFGAEFEPNPIKEETAIRPLSIAGIVPYMRRFEMTRHMPVYAALPRSMLGRKTMYVMRSRINITMPHRPRNILDNLASRFEGSREDAVEELHPKEGSHEWYALQVEDRAEEVFWWLKITGTGEAGPSAELWEDLIDAFMWEDDELVLARKMRTRRMAFVEAA